MIRRFLLFAFLFAPVCSMYAQFGLYASAAYISRNGSNAFYNNTSPGLGQNIGSLDFQGSNFGSFPANTGLLKILGAEIKTYKGPSDNVCSGTMYYTVYPTGSRPLSPVFSSVNLGFFSDCFAPVCGSFFGAFNSGSGGCCSAGDQKWQTPGSGSPVDIDLTNFAPDNYTLEVYYQFTGEDGGSGCGTTKYDNNSNNPTNYTLTFSITPPIPVKFGNISVTNNKTENLVSWSTFTEENSKWFVLEHSVDGSLFSGIGRIAAAGFSSLQKNYRLKDSRPANGYNYYRIKMIESDGRTEYSATVRTENNYSTDWYILNPGKAGIIQLAGLSNGDMVSLWSPSGNRIFHTKASSSSIDIPAADLARGTYFIKVVNSKGTSVKQVLVM